MLQSGCQEGQELRTLWASLQQEEQQAAVWLMREGQDTLSQELESVGGSSTDGSTRGRITEERDLTRGALIKKGLQTHPQQTRTNRPVWAWLQRDKLSSAWLQALPGPDSSLTSAEFAEASAAALCLPSPACKEKLGEKVTGRSVVDLYGDTVQSAQLPGDHWRRRHDRIKIRLYQLCQWAGVPCEMEVFNLFAGSIPQEGLNRMERGRKVQSIVPDLRITLEVEGNPVPSLHELKCISSSVTRYLPQWQGQEAVKAVDKRAGQLHQSYVNKARNTDRKYCGTPEGITGPVENKLASMGAVKGVVLGCFGEASQATHDLIYHLAVSRVRVAGPQRGRRGQFREEQAEEALQTAFLRRTISLCGVKAQSFSLLGRLEGLGSGGSAAARRRTYALNLERQWGNLRRAHALSVRQGRNILRSGQFMQL